MEYKFSKVINNLPPSFIDEIINLSRNKDIISFGGGLPDPKLFPHADISKASSSMFAKNNHNIYQYAMTEGHKGLREWIAKRFSKMHNIDVDAEQVLIMSGSQQVLDLFGKIYINPQDGVVMENPSYLGAIEAFTLYEPKLKGVSLLPDGVDTSQLADVMQQADSKFFYGIPNFQNPTGVTYSKEKRQQVAQILKDTGKLMLEDDPYGSIYFDEVSDDKGNQTNASHLTTTPIYALAPENVVYMGSFSKIFAPGFRLGWVIAPKPVIEKLILAKQASDIHTNSFVQELLYEYVTTNDIEAHISVIRQAYGSKKNTMVDAINSYLGDRVNMFPVSGGMFIWMQIPNINIMDFLSYAIKENVAFVPGTVFSLSGDYKDYMRLNFTSLENDQIVEGVKRLEAALTAYESDNH